MLNSSELKENDFLNERAGNASGIPLDEEFRMENFTYNNNVVAEVMFSHLNATNFIGITVSTLAVVDNMHVRFHGMLEYLMCFWLF